MKPTVADHIATFLVDRGVEQVFGLCGHTNISVLAAFARLGAPRFVTSPPRAGRRTRRRRVRARRGSARRRAPARRTRHHQRDHRRRDGRVRLDPAARDRRDVPSYYEGRGPHQEFNLRRDADQISVYEPFVKRAWARPPGDQVPRILARAWDTALAGRPGPVLVSIPMDILAEVLEADVVAASPVARPSIAEPAARAIAAELRGAARPLLLAGGGTRHAAGQDGGCRARRSAGRPHPDGHGGPAARPSPAARDHRVLGIAGRQPAGVRGRRDPGRRDAVPETDSSSWEPGVTFRIPPTRSSMSTSTRTSRAATTPRPSPPPPTRPSRWTPSPRRTGTRRRIAATTGQSSARSGRRSWLRAAPTPGRTTSPCCPSGSWPTCGVPSPTRSW